MLDIHFLFVQKQIIIEKAQANNVENGCLGKKGRRTNKRVNKKKIKGKQTVQCQCRDKLTSGNFKNGTQRLRYQCDKVMTMKSSLTINRDKQK